MPRQAGPQSPRGHPVDHARVLIANLIGRVAEELLRAGVPRRHAPVVVEHEHRVVREAVEHEAHARLDLAQAAIGGALRPVSTLEEELGVIQGRGRVRAKMRERGQVVLGKERAASLHGGDDAPRVAVAADRRHQHARAEARELRRELRLARRSRTRGRFTLQRCPPERCAGLRRDRLSHEPCVTGGADDERPACGDDRVATSVVPLPTLRCAASNRSSAARPHAFRDRAPSRASERGLLRALPPREQPPRRRERDVITGEHAGREKGARVIADTDK